jgi:hypothetical protein
MHLAPATPSGGTLSMILMQLSGHEMRYEDAEYQFRTLLAVSLQFPVTG